MMANISRLEQDIVDDHRLLIHTSSGMGHPFPAVPSLFSISLSLSSRSGGSMPCPLRRRQLREGRGQKPVELEGAAKRSHSFHYRHAELTSKPYNVLGGR